MNWARQEGATWFNNSWGVSETTNTFSRTNFIAAYPALLSAFRNGVLYQRVYVWAAGNEGGNNAQLFAALPVHFPELASNWLAVANVSRATGELHSSSSACGNAAAWCLAAPGTAIQSTWIGGTDEYQVLTGTSMAAPAVTGALALVSESFPTLSSSQVVQRLLITAERSGVYANSNLYGQGLLDVERATRPVGELQMVSQNTLSLSGSNLQLGPAFGSGNPLAGVQAFASDSQGAGFLVDLGQPIYTPAYRHASSSALQNLGAAPVAVSNSGTGWHYRHADGRLASQVSTLMRTADYQLHWGQIDNLDVLHGQHAWVGRSQLQVSQHAPYWRQRPQEQSTALHQVYQQGALSWHVTALGSEIRQGLLAGLSLDISDNYTTRLEWGQMINQDGLLGSRGRGSYALDEDSQTRFLSLSGQWQQGDVRLMHSAHWGRSRGEGQGLLQRLGRVDSSSWQLAAQWNNWGLALQQPLRVESARSQVMLAQGYVGNQFNLQPVNLDLTPDGRQMDLEVFWRRDTGHSGDLRVSWVGSRQPGHQANAAPMQAILLQWQQGF